ncbi:lytic transglycosylase [Thiosulfatimonas sediminis]|uniref:Lytic transglycosylase n=1 Tax=Thiosulfatimonas sediminis TaxID=2675054 RepID=A0A6F8PUE4_9GAMM|nr:lytic transglycosylase [Thiosulfatimonas sediminis]
MPMLDEKRAQQQDRYVQPVQSIAKAPITRPQTNKSSTLYLNDKPQIKQEIEAQYREVTKPEPHTNLWATFSGSFDLVYANEGHFEHSVSYYKKRQKHLIEVSKRAKPYLYYIVEEVKARNMPLEIALLPMVESGFKAHAKSHAQALGLWQFMPATGKSLGLENNWWYDGRRDVVKSTEAALTYLQRHYDNTQDWLLALASYNAGYGNVLKAIKRYQAQNAKTETMPSFWQISPYLPRETQNYVPALLSIAYLIEHNTKYDIAIEPIANQPFFDVIELNHQISLSAVAANTKISADLLAKLNPAYVRQATPPQGPHHILLPIEKQSLFNQAYRQNAQSFEVHWQRHRIQNGDYLGKIASHYGTSVNAIKKLNRMNSNFLRVGQTLLIPIVSDNSSLIATNKSNPLKTLQPSASAPAAPMPVKSEAQKHNKPSSSPSIQEKIIYQVKSGDTLSEIAQQNGVEIQQLREWNRLAKNAPLHIGQTIVMDKAAMQNQQLIHQVKSGETLSEIALAHGIEVKQIMAWNQLSSAKNIRPHQELRIWLGPKMSKHQQYIVRNGDNLWAIAKEFELSVEGLAQYNQMTLKTLLQPGQVIKIPFNTI